MNNTFDPQKEELFLDSLVSDYKDVSPYSQIKKDIILQLVNEFLEDAQNKSALQLGCANGYESSMLASQFRSLLAVDGSRAFIQQAQANNKCDNVEFKQLLFENMSSKSHLAKYDYIFCHYVLEHVFDPNVILQNIHSLLKPGGLLFVVVPNSQAFSRQLALQMGYIDNLEDLTENDLKHGHRRVYNIDSLLKCLTNNGFKVHEVRGVIFKMLADFQLNKLMSDSFLKNDHILAMHKLAQGANINFSDSLFLALRASLAKRDLLF